LMRAVCNFNSSAFLFHAFIIPVFTYIFNKNHIYVKTIAGDCHETIFQRKFQPNSCYHPNWIGFYFLGKDFGGRICCICRNNRAVYHKGPFALRGVLRLGGGPHQ